MKSISKKNVTDLNNWIPSNDFLVRTPTLSLNDYYNNMKDIKTKKALNDWVLNLINNSIIMEAIYVASPSLYQSLQIWNNINDHKRKEQIAISLNNYLIRMTSRTTPFGLFSSVTVGEFGNETSININPLNNVIKRCKPDMQWVYKLVRELENDNSIFIELNVMCNQLVEKVGNRYILSYNSKGGIYNDNKETDKSSIGSSDPIDMILNLTQNSIEIKKLLNLLKEQYPQVTEKKFLSLLHNLVVQDYLITDLRPSLLSKSPYSYVVNKVKTLKEKNRLQYQLDELISIESEIKNYEKLSIGDGLEQMKKIEEKMSKIVNNDIYLQVNMSLNRKNEVIINNRVKKDLTDLSEFLILFSCLYSKPMHLENYLNEFLIKYGDYREVELLELLNEDIGLGAPANYNNPKSTREILYSDVNHKLESYLLNKIITSVKENSCEIEITLEELIALNNYNKGENKQTEFIESFEVFGSIIAENIHSFNKGEYEIILNYENPVSNLGGKASGRFIDLIKNENKTKEIYRGWRGTDNTVIAEMSYTPTNGKIANIMNVENLFDFEINLNNYYTKNKKNISISDIVVGVEEDTFYLKSKKLNEKILINVNSLVNLDLTPNVFKFLHEVSLYNKQYVVGFHWGRFSESEFLPRVKYKRIILSPAIWNFKLSNFNDSKGVDYNEWLKTFTEWIKKWSVPKSIYLAEGDGKLLLDLNCTLHLKILYEKSKHKKNIKLIENELCSLKTGSEDKNKYNIEFVFPIINNCKNKTKTNTKESAFINSNSSIVKKHFGSDWLYLKLYFNSFRDEELISIQIPNFCNYLIKEKLIDKYFYVRFLDDKPHIRLRIHGKPHIILNKVLLKFKEWQTKLLTEGIINKTEISCYEREVERYGGPDFIDLCETLFYYDSMCVSELIDFLNYTNMNDTFEQETIAILSVIFYLEEIGLNFVQQLELFESIVQKDDLHKEFRKKRKNLIFLCNSNDNWLNLRSLEEGKKLIKILKKREGVISSLNKRLITRKKLIYNSYNDIWLSIIHLHLNRLLGVDREKERKVMSFVRYTLKNLKYYKGLI
ncbi:lantibiotic dehydratase [Bacillus siamensis]|uniref:lantibiotic dehydratase n=1 Tax=Bacillus siamensis TaxID=659243 RepID=UPI0022B7944B|nr:lantibiotic dehydratase [Bacillus siamensis]MDU0812815.1 lantibiotic dehydratase [Bacillus siamensis]MED5048483.1 lantibiotic dehydratase [Bacillus siamensis]MED5096903.1 lantibiotic dehydratase [Bacillus siamensis]